MILKPSSSLITSFQSPTFLAVINFHVLFLVLWLITRASGSVEATQEGGCTETKQNKTKHNTKRIRIKYGGDLFIFFNELLRGAWVAQSFKPRTSAQVMISWLVSSSPELGSVLTAQSLEPVVLVPLRGRDHYHYVRLL